MSEPSLKQFVLKVLDEQKAIDPVICDVRGLSSIADYFVVCTSRSSRHSQTIADKIVEAAKKASIPVLGVEGKEAAVWILVDLTDVVVHIMQADTRNFYQLEKLWGAPADNLIEAMDE